MFILGLVLFILLLVALVILLRKTDRAQRSAGIREHRGWADVIPPSFDFERDKSK